MASKVFLLLFFLEILASCTTAQNPSPPYGSNTSFSSSTAVVMVVLVSVFFLLGFFSVYIRQCADRRITLTGGIDGNFIGSIGRRRGLDEAVINSFPTFEYSSVKWLKIGKGALECAVCLTEFEDDETLRLIPKCNHVFHPNCIDVWLGSHSTCPVCRANLVAKPEEMPYPVVDLFNSETEPGELDRRSNTAEELVHDQISIHVPQSMSSTPKRDLARSPVANSISPLRKINPIQSLGSRSSGFRLPGLLPRSHSTGHSIVQVGENWERFTLRLPDEVRNEILNSGLHRSKSCAVLPRARSSRKGYRNGSGGSSRGKYYDREVKPDRWWFSMTPPFISRTGPVRSPKMATGGSEEGSYNNNPRTLLQSVKSPFDRLILGIDTKNNSSSQSNEGERSFDRLRSDNIV